MKIEEVHFDGSTSSLESSDSAGAASLSDELIAVRSDIPHMLRKLVYLLHDQTHIGSRLNLLSATAAAATDSALTWVLVGNAGETIADFLELASDDAKILTLALTISGSLTTASLNFNATYRFIDKLKVFISSLSIIPNSLKYYILVLTVGAFISGVSSFPPAGLLYYAFDKTAGAIVLASIEAVIMFFVSLYYVQSSIGRLATSICSRVPEIQAEATELKSWFSHMGMGVSTMSDGQFAQFVASLDMFHQLERPSSEDFEVFKRELFALFPEIEDDKSQLLLSVANTSHGLLRYGKWLPVLVTAGLNAYLTYFVGTSTTADMIGEDPDDPGGWSITSTSVFLSVGVSLSFFSYATIFDHLSVGVQRVKEVLSGRRECCHRDDAINFGKSILSVLLNSISSLTSLDLTRKFLQDKPELLQKIVGAGSWADKTVIGSNAMYELPFHQVAEDICAMVGNSCIENMTYQRREFVRRMDILAEQVNQFVDSDVHLLYNKLKESGLLELGQ